MQDDSYKARTSDRLLGLRDYAVEIQHIKQADITSVADVSLRLVLVGTAGVALYALTGSAIYLAWAATYLITNLIYCLYLARVQAPVPLRTYLQVVLMNMVTSSSFAVMPVYLWLTTGSRALEVLAVCGVFGHAMYNLSRHTRVTLITFWDAVVMIASIGTIGWYEIIRQPDLTAQFAIGFGCVAVVTYYLLAQQRTISDREALASSREELLDAQRMSAMGQITAGVAHDFNNKLTAIQGNIELASVTADPSERAECLSEARRACRRAAEVVASMQAFVRKSPLRLGDIHLPDFCQNLSAHLLPYLPDTVDFGIEIDPSVDEMRCDAHLLRTALENLALNARDAMEQTGGKIELRIAPGDLANWSGKRPEADGPFIRFDMCDEGPGLPVSAFSIVQQPFYSSKPAGMGTGLGLSMVKGFAEQIGGALMMRNRPEGGLVVSLILPQSPDA
jgi:signal transduction histidine kinase